jgi:hypothetical protein
MIENDLSEADLSGSVFKNIPRKQKVAVFALALGAVAIIVFWVWQLNANLTSPFESPNEDKNKKLAANNAASQSPNPTDLTIDTDKDGLSDYSEINSYKTSPYLEDTDSDGISDSEEVKNGTDPTCPIGKVCNGIEPSSPTSSSTSQTTLVEAPALSIPAEMASSSQQTLQDTLEGKVNAATLRDLLLKSGADKAMLDQISDDELMKSYQENLQNQQ